MCFSDWEGWFESRSGDTNDFLSVTCGASHSSLYFVCTVLETAFSRVFLRQVPCHSSDVAESPYTVPSQSCLLQSSASRGPRVSRPPALQNHSVQGQCSHCRSPGPNQSAFLSSMQRGTNPFLPSRCTVASFGLRSLDSWQSLLATRLHLLGNRTSGLIRCPKIEGMLSEVTPCF